jgi:hypothetical protein
MYEGVSIHLVTSVYGKDTLYGNELSALPAVFLRLRNIYEKY